MREYKFRGKKIDNGEWVEGYLFEQEPPLVVFSSDKKDKSKWYIVKTGFADWGMSRPAEFHEVDPTTICEYTGLHDKERKRDMGKRYNRI